MPPRLSESWNFGSWDSLRSFTPPWQHRGFWYHDMSGTGSGRCLVIVWRYSFDEGGRQIVTGDIYRYRHDDFASIQMWIHFKDEIDRNNGYSPDGVFVFYGTRHIGKHSIYGQPLPPELQNLPDGRWLE
jgi:hypothetical protein